MIFIACPASLASCQLGLHDPDNMAGSPLDGAVGPGWSAEPAEYGEIVPPVARPTVVREGILTLTVAVSRFWGARCGITSLAVQSMGRHLGGGEWHAFVGEERKAWEAREQFPIHDHADADCRGARRWPASYERRQCCWNPETPSQSAGIRGATLDFCRCLQWGWPTCALRDSLPVACSLPGSLAAQVPTSSRLPDGYHRANGTGASSGFGSAGQLPPLKRSFCTPPHRTAPRS